MTEYVIVAALAGGFHWNVILSLSEEVTVASVGANGTEHKGREKKMRQ